MHNFFLDPLTVSPGPDTAPPSGARRLHVKVLFTDERETERALRHAGRLGAGLDARIELVVAHVVPWPLPLAQPDVDGATRTGMLRRLVESTGVPARVTVYLCRDRNTLLDEVLPRGTPVVVGGTRQARALRRRGHCVFVAAREGGSGFAGRVLCALHDSALRGLLVVCQGLRSAVR